MTTAELVAAILFLAVTAYAVLGGADFGSGFWDLVAGGSEEGSRTRQLIDHSIGPVWEANHVWLIFVLVFLWTGFPEVFATFSQAVDVPMWLVGLGIVIRGASFAFRKYSPSWASARFAGAAFAGASLMTPFLFGMIVGAVASGRIDPESPGETVWWSPTSLLGGILAVLSCAFLAGVFLTADAGRLGLPKLAASLRRRSLTVAALTGVVSAFGVVVIALDAPTLFEGLLGRGLPLMVLASGSGMVTMYLTYRNRFRWARISAVVAVAAVILGWGAGSYPWLLVDHVTIAEGAGHPATMTALVIAGVVAAVLVLPSLFLLFYLAERNLVGVETSPPLPLSPTPDD